MTSSRKRRGKVVGAPGEQNMGIVATGVMKPAKRTNVQCHKTTGKRDDFSVENDENCSPTGSAVAVSLQHPGKGACLFETTKKLPALDLYPEQILHLSTKIKLQLFPLDEGTRIGLEKDGFHPYLELTLSKRKKISSVLKHLNSKWGDSNIAIGEPILFPYNVVENFASYRWTMNDIDISAGDVYTAIGAPAVFRLRYAWSSNTEASTSEIPCTSTSTGGSLKAEVQQGCSPNVANTYGKVKEIEATSEEYEHSTGHGATTAVLAENMPFDRPIDPEDTEVRIDGNVGQSSLLWADSLSNISIGGLLSEASLQGRFNACDAKLNGINSGLQPSQLICDSFDAFLAGQMSHSQGPRPPPPPSHDSHSSILDAEDTCHAFAFQKFSSSEKESKSCSQGAGPKSFKFPSVTEANAKPALSQGNACQESEADLQFRSRVYNDESSLGLSGIKWTDSLGPFDLGLSSSRKIISGDNISMSGIVN
ncbi:TSL-kinase interacting protein 1 isoform X1 [Pistacia vera]|uniref:TSL-kinase interacting protein 1 isoform X1 n=1 Tax=Pistacia vera TaxID=55513 RepID=UPI001262D563|nr:TSL-kinase interacting protein 1 isoform X1 [Pistacia vera]